jgi:hypothetical protein
MPNIWVLGRLNYRRDKIWEAGLVACFCYLLQRAVGAYAIVSSYGVGLRDTDTDTTLWLLPLRAARGLGARSVWS